MLAARIVLEEATTPRLLVTVLGSPGADGRSAATETALDIDPNATVLRSAYSDVDRLFDILDGTEFDAWLIAADSDRARKLVVEVTARNHLDNRTDALGEARPGPIEEEGPATRSATLWTRTVRWVPSLAWHVSQDAGGSVANYALYQALARYPTRAVGLVHIPPEKVLTVESGTRILCDLLSRCVPRTGSSPSQSTPQP